MAYNVRAAWRSGGLHYRLCGRQTFIYALPFPRGYCRRCAKPPVVCSCIFRECCLCHFHFMVGLYFLFGSVTLSASWSDCTFSKSIPVSTSLSGCYLFNRYFPAILFQFVAWHAFGAVSHIFYCPCKINPFRNKHFSLVYYLK